MIQLNQGKDIQVQPYCKYYDNPIIQVMTNELPLVEVLQHMIKKGKKKLQIKF